MINHSIKILLLNPPFSKIIIRDNYCCFTSKSSYIWPPVDLLYLSGNLFHPNIKLFTIDAVAQKLSPKKTQSLIKKIKPNIIISLTGTASYVEDMQFLKKNIFSTKRKLFLLGNFPSFEPIFFLKKYPFVTGIIHNFFEPKIADYLLKQVNPPSSISYKKNKKYIIGKTNCFSQKEIPSLIHPPQYQLFSLKKYSSPLSLKKPFTTVLTSFGCPYNCQFCVGSCLKFIPRNIDDLKKEFDAIKSAKIKEIFFEDSTFNANSDYTKKVCQLMIDQKYNFSWNANVHNHNLTSEILRLMKQAGCHTINIGVESGNSDTLQKYAPTKNHKDIKKAFNLCKKLKIRTLGFFIIGFPNENKINSLKTIKLAIKIDPDFASFSILTPDYGTKIHSESIRNGYIKSQKISFNSSGKAILKNPQFSISDQNKILRLAYISFYLRPQKIFKLILNTRNYLIYFQNGISLIKNQILK